MKTLKSALVALICTVLALSSAGVPALAETEDLRTVTILCKKTFNQYWDLEDRESNLCYQAFTEELAKRGIRIEYDLVDNASIFDIIQTRMAAQVDLPDIIAETWSGVTDSELIAWGGNDLVVDLNEAVAQYDDDGSIFTYYEDHCPGVHSALTASDGGLYWFSYLYAPSFVNGEGKPLDYPGNPSSLSIRKDWLDAIGMKYDRFMTMDELYDALTAIQEADVNGNGVKDEIVAVDISGMRNGIATAFGLSGQLLASIDSATNQITSDFYKIEFLSYIQYMQKLYQTGLYDTSALGEGMIDQLVADNKASLTYGYSYWTSYENTISSTDEACYAPFILDDDGGENGWNLLGDPPFTTYCHYFVPSASKNVEAVIDLFDYIYTGEYAMLNQYGIEGYSFEYDENGIPQKLWDSTMESAAWDGCPLFYTVGLYALPAMVTTPWVLKAMPSEEPALQIKDDFHVWYYDHCTKGNVMSSASLSTSLALPSEDESVRLGEIENVLSTYASELLTDLILGNRSLDDLADALAQMESLGLTEYLQIMQARYDRYLASAQ